MSRHFHIATQHIKSISHPYHNILHEQQLTSLWYHIIFIPGDIKSTPDTSHSYHNHVTAYHTRTYVTSLSHHLAFILHNIMSTPFTPHSYHSTSHTYHDISLSYYITFMSHHITSISRDITSTSHHTNVIEYRFRYDNYNGSQLSDHAPGGRRAAWAQMSRLVCWPWHEPNRRDGWWFGQGLAREKGRETETGRVEWSGDKREGSREMGEERMIERVREK